MDGDSDRQKRQRWNLLGSVSALAAALAPRFVQGSRSAIVILVAFAVTFAVATYFGFRYGPGPYRPHDRLTR